MVREDTVKIDWSKPIETFRSDKAFFIHRLENCEESYPMVVIITDAEGHETCETFTEDGIYDIMSPYMTWNLRNVEAGRRAA